MPKGALYCCSLTVRAMGFGCFEQSTLLLTASYTAFDEFCTHEAFRTDRPALFHFGLAWLREQMGGIDEAALDRCEVPTQLCRVVLADQTSCGHLWGCVPVQGRAPLMRVPASCLLASLVPCMHPLL